MARSGEDAKQPAGADEDQPSYEQARDQLAQVVKALEQGGLPLEESLALWERGERLAAICEQWLEGARARLAAALAGAEDDRDAATGEPATTRSRGKAGNGEAPF